MCIARQLSCSLTKLIRCHAVWPDWAIFYTFGNFLKPLATTNLPKSLTFLGNFCKGVKSYHFLVKSILGNVYRHLVNFFWSHWIVVQQNCVIFAGAENVSIKIYVLPCRLLSPASAARNLALWRLKRMDYQAMLRQKAWTPFAPGPRLSGRYCHLSGIILASHMTLFICLLSIWLTVSEISGRCLEEKNEPMTLIWPINDSLFLRVRALDHKRSMQKDS